MEYAKKMVLIPENHLHGVEYIHQPQLKTVQTPGSASSRLDSEMNEILHDTTITNDREKWSKYQQVLQRYLTLKNLNEQKNDQTDLRHELEEKLDDDIEEKKRKKEIEKILGQVPKTYRQKALKFLNFISQTSNIRWRSDGRIVINDTVLPNSNVSDLVNDAMRYKKGSHVVGRSQLAIALRRVAIPPGLIGNSTFWDAGNESILSFDDDVPSHSSPENSSAKKVNKAISADTSKSRNSTSSGKTQETLDILNQRSHLTKPLSTFSWISL